MLRHWLVLRMVFLGILFLGTYTSVPRPSSGYSWTRGSAHETADTLSGSSAMAHLRESSLKLR